MARTKDRHIVVTGAGTGIGRAIAHRLGQDGARLTLCGRRVELLEQTAEAASAAGARAVRVASLDIRDRAAVDAAFTTAAADFGPIHALVANAGVGGPNADGDDDRFFDLVQTNLVGTYHTCRAALRNLESGPHARHLVVVASILGRFGVPGYTGYCASKTGLLGMVRAFAKEVASLEVQVNAICPGWVSTEMAWQGIDGMAAGMGVTRDEALAIAMREVPLGRMSEPRDVAGVVAWLLSNDARGVTGQGIDVNGGAWMG
jgi:NAD(P)-dependent dehydrogenase (short-subunit alcohol dehydrogenase family)